MMRPILFSISALLTRWGREEKAVAAVESAILFPVMITLLMGVYDIGNGIVINQKTITASQVMADLVARNQFVDMDAVNDIAVAGRMAMEPFATNTMGYDVISVEFDEDEEPEVLWRVTSNMVANEHALDSTEIIAEAGNGVIVVTVSYEYKPFFSHFIVDEINMQEVAYLRGRRSATVTCGDCPGE